MAVPRDPGNGAMDVDIDIQIASNEAGIPREAEIRSWLEDVIGRSGDSGRTAVSVRVVDEPEGRDLNRRFRRQDKATNVLSFPADQEMIPDGMARQLGDIVICGPVVMQEAMEQGKELHSHWAHMVVHGALHLLGYDHESSEDAAVMESLEKEILATRGIGDPYAVTY